MCIYALETSFQNVCKFDVQVRRVAIFGEG